MMLQLPQERQKLMEVDLKYYDFYDDYDLLYQFQRQIHLSHHSVKLMDDVS